MTCITIEIKFELIALHCVHLLHLFTIMDEKLNKLSTISAYNINIYIISICTRDIIKKKKYEKHYLINIKHQHNLLRNAYTKTIF